MVLIPQWLMVRSPGQFASTGGQTAAAGQDQSNVGQVSSRVRNGGTGGQPGKCNSNGDNYQGGVGAVWFGQGCTRLGSSHGERGGSRA
ncbi:hypothetical protein pdam_00021409 [Pocillopora damicornis]|uniref:Uncharacterized protein n=1 Tax=Pocillopora damicornis TaxID=46731 RepID=A0A3M6UW82_POCDA|nr:hypothetical protein pdam_00021409 [Pocillopora damicornis]